MELSKLQVAILEACRDDEVGLWEVIRVVTRAMVRDQWGDQSYSPPQDIWTKEKRDEVAAREEAVDQSKLQGRTLEALYDLLDAGLIVAGAPEGGGRWKGWELAPTASIARIRNEWDTLGHLPTPGDIAWFISTTEGDRVLHEGKERNAL